MRSGTTQRISGIFLLSIGALLLVGTLAYFGYGVYARSQLAELGYESERPAALAESQVDAASKARSQASAAALPDELGGRDPASGSSDAQAIASVGAGDSREAGLGAAQAPGSTAGDQSATAAETDDSPSASISVQPQGILGQSLDDGPSSLAAGEDQALTRIEAGLQDASQTPSGEQTAVGSSADASASADGSTGTAGYGPTGAYAFAFGPGASTEDPAIAMTAARIEASLTEALSYAAPTGLELIGDKGAATRIRIPAINVDTVVHDLRVVYTNQSYAWETPKHVVGHIPTTGRPGTGGQGWYFGHLESPIRGEGNVFSRLPEIPELAKGNPIYVFLETEGVKYVYQVYQTSVMHQDDLKITDSGERDITLVTCTPRFYYDHRLLVTAALVGVSKSAPDGGTSS